MKKIIMLVSVLVMVMFAGCDTVGEQMSYNENFELGQISMIEIETGRIDINVIQEDRDDVLVEFSTFDNGADFDVDEDNDTLYITTKENDDVQINVTNSGGPELTVKIPVDYEGDLTLKTESGDVVMESLALGSVEVDMDSGDLVLDDICCKEFDVETENGEVELDMRNCDFDGSLGISTGDGKIEVRRNGDKVKYEGEYETEFGDSERIITIVTDGGDVEVIE